MKGAFCFFMNCRVTELCNKQVINIENGECIGTVNDVEIDTKCANVISIVVFGRPKCFGLFGRENDCIIPWCNIQVIGEDTVLVKCECSNQERKKRMVDRLFGE